MRLYLVRHAEAVATGAKGAATDAARFLTTQGKKSARDAAKALKVLGVRPAEIWTSPLIRARETTDLLAGKFSPAPPIHQVNALGCPGDFEVLRKRLQEAECEELVLVGHQPFLGECAQYWLAGRAHPGMRLAKSSVLCLEGNGIIKGQMELKFMLSNKLNKLLAATASRKGSV